MSEHARSERSTRKRSAILTAAREAFLAGGFDTTSMDAIAAAAAVSKQTVYAHFSDKRALFEAIVLGTIADAEARTSTQVDALGASDDLERDLRAFARRHVEDVLDPDVVRLRRVVIAEAERFPELARTWYAAAPARAAAVLARQLDRLAARGLLGFADAALAAQYLNWLILAAPLELAMFHPEALPLPRAQLHGYADEGVRIFLAAHRPDAGV